MVLKQILGKVFGTKGDRDYKVYWPTVEQVNAMEDEISRRSDEEILATTERFQRFYLERKCELFLRQADRVEVGELYNPGLRDQIGAMREASPEGRVALFSELRPNLGVHDLRGGAPTDVLKERQKDFVKGKRAILFELLPEAFALCREVSKRTTGLRHYDVQIMGGMVLFEGKIAEMATGEGKTLVATLPLYLYGLTREGCHLVTVNDYLAKFHCRIMGPIYRGLGLSVGAVYNDMPMDEKRQAYACDITYGTNNEFGFDYLRDHMAQHPDYCFQRGLNFAIVDEVDSILVDEARTPLIISGPAQDATEVAYRVDAVVRKLSGGSATTLKFKEEPPEDWDYAFDEKDHNCYLTEKGMGRAQKLLNVENLYSEENLDVVHYLNQALRAHTLYEKDVEYVVKEGEVIIVDEFTGRLMPGRRWADGLHQAVEAKESLQIQRENQTLATITLQNYFRLYDTLAGMTGTADTEAQEFHDIYKLDVVVIPTNKPCVRMDMPDLILRSKQEKFESVVEEIAEMKDTGRPVLVGTISIEDSEYLSGLLKKAGVKHNVLNAKQHDREALFVAQAGRYGMVTIATNMAGRGTDILLGGNPEMLADELLKIPHAATQEEKAEALTRAEEICREEGEKVRQLGGLHVLGTQRHESRRIDNQLRGRCARQGDPGSSQFYLCLEDDLMRLFGGERIKRLATAMGMQEGEAITHRWVSRSVRKAQKRIETRHFESRKHILKFDDVMNTQRTIIYEMRDRLMSGEDPTEDFKNMLENVVDRLVGTYAGEGTKGGEWNIDGLRQQYANLLKAEDAPELDGLLESDQVLERLTEGAREVFDTRRGVFDDPNYVGAILRWLMLRRIDAKWKDHLLGMDHLKEGLTWSANDPRYVQGRPEIAYQQEGFRMFEEMMDALEADVVRDFFHVEILSPEEREERMRASQEEMRRRQKIMEQRARRAKATAAAMGGGGAQSMQAEADKPQPRRVGKKTRPNDPCPCGSGQKYKRCCGRV